MKKSWIWLKDVGRALRGLLRVLRYLFAVGLGFAIGVYAIGWVILVLLVNFLGWLGVNGFPKPFPWWMPFIAAGLVALVRRAEK
jgi:hypothetical protein